MKLPYDTANEMLLAWMWMRGSSCKEDDFAIGYLWTEGSSYEEDKFAMRERSPRQSSEALSLCNLQSDKQFRYVNLLCCDGHCVAGLAVISIVPTVDLVWLGCPLLK